MSLGLGINFWTTARGGAFGGGSNAPGIRLSANSLTENSAQATAVGTLSVFGGTGTYTFTLTDTAGTRFQVAGTNGVNLQAGATASNAEVSTAYSITVHADNGAGSTFDRTFGIAIADVNEATPVITSNGAGSTASVSVAENTTAVTTVTATDADVSASIVYSISGGADSAKFTINSTTGALSFATAPDFEIPTDANTDNIYVVIVTASDGTNTDTQTISVTVTDVADTGGSVPTAFGLTDIASGRLFQRTKTLTTGPVSASGTYSGGTPNAIELQVLKVSDNSVVKDWTTASGSIGVGAWSASITGVAQGGSYYVKARPSNATGLAATGSNPFYVGVLILIYGQSNALNLVGESSSPPAASAGTTWFDGAAWTSVPAANGVRELLNGVLANTSIPCAAIGGGAAGTSLAELLKGAGTGHYEALLASVVASGGDAEFTLWRHGENAASGVGVAEATYRSQFTTLHSDLAADVGRTVSQIPIIVSGLAWTTSASYDNDLWDAAQRTLLNLPSLTATYYSHSNLDAALKVDELHEAAADCGNEGKRFARTISTILGSTSGYPRFSITSSAVVDATNTDVTVTHDMGSDITPTSSITGFEVSGNNGSSWAAPSASARQSANVIRLTHSSLATTSARKLRYLYGKNPTRTGLVKDNSSLAVPLLMSAAVLSPTPLATLPTPTFLSVGATAATGTTQTRSGISIAPASARKLLVASITLDSGVAAINSITMTPNVGTAKSATIIQQSGGVAPIAAIAYAVLDADADTATSADVAVTFSGNTFVKAQISLWYVPSADLSSTTPFDSDKTRNASGNTLSLDIDTSSGGYIIAVAISGSATSNSCLINGDETYTERFDTASDSAQHCAADASNTSGQTGTNTITATFAQTDTIALIAASWR